MNDLYNEFLDTLDQVHLCPYCCNEIEEGQCCCSEIHGETGYQNIDGEYFLESDLDAAFKDWINLQKQVTIERFKKLLSSLSYYNAAESDNFTRETLARQTCQFEVKETAARLRLLEIDPNEIIKGGGFLVDPV